MNEAGRPALPAEQVVLVLQGGGALGAYQAGVYEGLHEAGVEPTWVVGTSIGAINAALICGNKPEDRLGKLKDFWSRVPWSLSDRYYVCYDDGKVESFGKVGASTPG